MSRRLAHKVAELVRSVQGGRGCWSSARWTNGAIVVVDGTNGAPPCEHRFKAFKDWRGMWTGKATCVYCRKQTSWKTKAVNAKRQAELYENRSRRELRQAELYENRSRQRKPYAAPTVRDVELDADLPGPLADLVNDAKLELAIHGEQQSYLTDLNPPLRFRFLTLHSRNAVRSRFRS